MSEIRREIARIVEEHIEEILDRTMTAFETEIPAVARADERARGRVRASTRRATLAFLALYADPDSPARAILDEARRATTDRAGEDFERDEILGMFRVARQVIFGSARELVVRELGHPTGEEAAVGDALDAFLDELERSGDAPVPGGDTLRQLLAEAEAEEPDIR